MNARKFKLNWITIGLVAGIGGAGGLLVARSSNALPYYWDGGTGGGSRERICLGEAIGADCRNTNTSREGCRSCVTFTCDANCDHAMDFFLCCAAGNPKCEGLPNRLYVRAPWRIVTVSNDQKQDKAHSGCGGDPDRVRPDYVVRAWSIGRKIARMLERGDLDDAYALLDRLFAQGEKIVALEGPVRGKPVTDLDKKARPLGRMLQYCLLTKDRESARALVDLCALKEAQKKAPLQEEDLIHLKAWAANPKVNVVVRAWIESVVTQTELKANA